MALYTGIAEEPHLITPSKKRLNNMLNLQTRNQPKIPRIKRIRIHIGHKQIFRITQHPLSQTILRHFMTINIRADLRTICATVHR